jgi:hypothetical protein
MSNTINAAANPALANQLLNQALTEVPQEITPEIISPSDTSVDLPGGYINAAGEVIRTVEVRELNGKDEEAISKAPTLGKALMTILQRGTVKVGDQKVDDKILDTMLIGDRDSILLGILKATFGPKIEIQSYCSGCNDFKSVEINVNDDIKVKVLNNPEEDRVFTVQGKNTEYVVQLPNGNVQKAMIDNMDKTSAELSTLVLEGTLVRRGNSPVISKNQVQNLSLVDRRTLIEELNKRAVGPQFDDLTIKCTDCEGEVLVPINLGTLFQF